MLMHLGNGFSVRSERILLMADLSLPIGADTRRLLADLRSKNRVFSPGKPGEAPKTLVLLKEKDGVRACMSPVGLRTLRLRAETVPWPARKETGGNREPDQGLRTR